MFVKPFIAVASLLTIVSMGRRHDTGGDATIPGRQGPVQLVAGVDVKSTERFDWSPATIARAGFEMTRSEAAGHPARLVAFVLELYQGPSPYGQFFQNDISYIGFGGHLGL